MGVVVTPSPICLVSIILHLEPVAGFSDSVGAMSLVLTTQQSFQSDYKVDFLLPTGILIMLECRIEQTIAEIKDRLWTEARKLPLFQQLRQSEWYVLVFVNKRAQLEECLDETQRLSDLQMYKPLFKVVEKKGNEAEKKLSNEISWLIGRQLKDFENSRDPEVHDFRVAMIEKCQMAVEGRTNFSWVDKLYYIYPPSLEASTAISSVLRMKLTHQGEFRIHVDFAGLGRPGQKSTILVNCTDTPEIAVEKALKKVTRSEGEEKDHANTDIYVLKVCVCVRMHVCVLMHVCVALSSTIFNSYYFVYKTHNHKFL